MSSRSPRSHRGARRDTLARDLFTFGHFPIVFGLILYAVVVKHLVPHPDGHLTVDDRWLLALSVAFFVAGLLAIQVRVLHRMAPERIVAIPVAAGLCAAGAFLPGLVVVASIAVMLGLMQTITWRRFRVGPLAHAIAND